MKPRELNCSSSVKMFLLSCASYVAQNQSFLCHQHLQWKPINSDGHEALQNKSMGTKPVRLVEWWNKEDSVLYFTVFDQTNKTNREIWS